MNYWNFIIIFLSFQNFQKLVRGRLKNMNKKITVIIPVYNTENYVERCIRSIINQTYSNLEIICINDGSSDNSLEVLQNLKKEDDRILIISQSNKGVGAARNVGIDNSTGDYISFVDSDDVIDENYFAELLYRAVRYNLDLIGSNICAISNNGIVYPFERQVSEEVLINSQIIKAYLNFQISPAIWGKLYRRDLIGKTRFPLININEDFIFGWEIIKKTNRFLKTNDTHYNYYEDRVDSLTKKVFSENNMSIIEHAGLVLNNTLDNYPELLTDAKNYFYAFVLHNLILYYKYLKTCDGSELYIDEKNVMENLLKNKEELNCYFLPFEKNINIQEMLNEINNLIITKRGNIK